MIYFHLELHCLSCSGLTVPPPWRLERILWCCVWVSNNVRPHVYFIKMNYITACLCITVRAIDNSLLPFITYQIAPFCTGRIPTLSCTTSTTIRACNVCMACNFVQQNARVKGVDYLHHWRCTSLLCKPIFIDQWPLWQILWHFL